MVTLVYVRGPGMVYPETFLNTVAEVQEGKTKRTAQRAVHAAMEAIVGAMERDLHALPTTLDADYAELRQGRSVCAVA